MPSGPVHTSVNLGALGLMGVLATPGKWWQWPEAWWFLGAYLFSTFFLSPDLDLWHSQSRRSWGALGILWLPYARLFRHRGLSHHWLWGPLSRVGYLALLALPLLALWPRFDPSWLSEMRRYGGWILLGIYIPHWLHIALDAWAP